MREERDMRQERAGVAAPAIAKLTIGICLAALLACCFASPLALAAKGESEFELAKAFGPDGTAATEFDSAGSVAIDHEEGILYVLDRGAHALYKFDLQGNPVAFGGSSPDVSGNKLANLPLTRVSVVAVNPVNHAVYVTGEPFVERATALLAFQPTGEPLPFTAGPGNNTNKMSFGQAPIKGVAVDPAGDIYISIGTYSNGNEAVQPYISVYAKSGALVLAAVHVEGVQFDSSSEDLAVSEDGDLYLDVFTRFVFKLSPMAFPLAPDTQYKQDLGYAGDGSAGSDEYGITGIDLELATNRLFVAMHPENKEHKDRVDIFDEEGQISSSFGGFGESGQLDHPTDVAFDSETGDAFVPQSPEVGVSQVKIFQAKRCVCPPAISRTGVSEVAGDSAKLRARVNPDTFDTTYWFEYGTEDCKASACAKEPLGGAQIPAGFRSVAVSRTIVGLQPKTLYHYRVVATNQLGATEGPDRTFTTQGSGLGFQLPDSRAWEMVSPSDKHGGSLILRPPGIIQAAEDGDGLAFLTRGSIEAEPEGNRALEASSVLAHREAGGSWHSKDITPPHTKLIGIGDAEFKLMTPDLSRAFMEARDDTPLSPLTTERTPYIRENTEPPVYTPLLTSAEGYADVAPGTVFGDGVHPVGANADLSTVALNSAVPLVEGAPPAALYIWSGGQLKLASKLPADKKGAVVIGVLGSQLGSVRNAVSSDGARAFWSTGEYHVNGIGTTALYLRDTSLEETIRLDLVEAGVKEPGPPRPAFQVASTDGIVVFFTDSRHLKKTSSPEGRDLYRCEIPSGASLGGCATLTDISAPLSGSGESADVKDQALAASEDGSRIYFVAEGVLDTEANEQGDSATKKAPNLYLWEKDAGVRFIATLSEEDRPNWGAEKGLAKGFASNIAADASPDGRYLAFMSKRSLNGDDNETTGGEGAEEAYRYDALTGELACVSCNPTGGSPRAMFFAAGDNRMVDPVGIWRDAWMAATLPDARFEGTFETFYRPRTVLDDGRVFFNAYDSLVPADSNGDWDVYQYESTETGSCTSSTGDAATVRSGEGCVSLISSGTAEEEAAFLDASLSGDDVFFLSPSKLSVLDEDSIYDVYDARVGGVVAKLPDLAECQGEACQPVVGAPDDPTPASSSFEGAGNVPPEGKAPTQARCPKGKHRAKRNGKRVCVAKKHRKQGRHLARRNRGAAR